MVCDAFGGCRYCKIINLLHEEDMFIEYCARVDACFVDSWGEAYTAEDFGDVLFPEAR